MQLELIKSGINKKSRTLYGVYYFTPTLEDDDETSVFTFTNSIKNGGASTCFFAEVVPNRYSDKKVYDLYFNYDGYLKSYADIFIDRGIKGFYSDGCIEFAIAHEIGHIAKSHGSDNNKLTTTERELEADKYAAMLLGRNCYNELHELLVKSHERAVSHGLSRCSLKYLLEFHGKRLEQFKHPKRKIV